MLKTLPIFGCVIGIASLTSCNDKDSDTSGKDSGEVTSALDSRFVSIVAAIPRVEMGLFGPTLFKSDDFRDGLKSRQETRNGRTVVQTFTLNGEGLPTKIT
ncbi:MAG: hypothetical protein IOD12_09325 [Silvanigrellales bacterium]|jgi:hypothetical protein|nr:hypothetical protein [Silvanigrellales bacterium]